MKRPARAASRIPFRHLATGGIWVLLIWGGWEYVQSAPTPAEIGALARASGGYGLVGLGAAVIAATVIRAERWRLMLRPSVTGTFSDFLLAFGWCFLVQLMAPFRSDEIARPLWVRERGGPFLLAVGVSAAERMLDVMALAVMLIAAAMLNPGLGGALRTMAIVCLTAMLAAGAVLAALAPSHILSVWLGNRPRLARWARNFEDGFAILSDPRKAIRVLVMTILAWGALGAGYWVAFAPSFPDEAPLMALTVLPMVNLAGLFWVAPGNIGMYQAAVVLSLAAFQVPADRALPVGILLHAIVLGVVTVFGLGCKFILSYKARGKDYSA